MKQLYILGICGTFMGSLAVLAKEMGFAVAGCDENIYPPMSTQLEEAGIELDQGFKAEHLQKRSVDLVIVGNALSRGNQAIEYLLNSALPFQSGPEFLHDTVLKDRWVLAVSGTHGKTTTSSMLAWILDQNGVDTGFLIGGVVNDFPLSARLGSSPYFVIEADEYDTAFFDKRSKFVHYKPKTLVINNIEFDHADIFQDISDIYKQFNHLMRIVPSEGSVVYPLQDNHVKQVISMGCWSNAIKLSQELLPDTDYLLHYDPTQSDGFDVKDASQSVLASVGWSLLGRHNAMNGFSAMIAASTVGISLQDSAKALCTFQGVKRRMELLGAPKGIHVYDDFAHHPTAIKTSLEALSGKEAGRVIAVIELASNTMKQGVHQHALEDATASARSVFFYTKQALSWSWPKALGELYGDIDNLMKALLQEIQPGDHVVLMSNGSFGGLRGRLVNEINEHV